MSTDRPGHRLRRRAPVLAVVLAVLGAIVAIGALAAPSFVTPCPDRPGDPTCLALGAGAPGSAPSPGSSAEGSPMEGPDGQPLPSVEALPSTGVESPGPRSTSYTFDDEFNGSTLSPSWGRHWGSLGLSTLSAAQATVGGGVLTITAQRSGGSWTSDLIDTFDTFRQKYGFFEARMKVPEGRGLWPAFWIADDWAHSGAEFDIAEICANPPGTNYGNDITVLHQIIHGATVYRVGAKAFRIAPLSDAWHTYGLDWRPNAVTFYFDGVATWRYTNPGLIPDVAMSPILSFELGTWCGPPDASTPSPSQMQVDWIRVQA